MTLFPPVGSNSATFGYTADVRDGVVPRIEVSALPINPLESPTFASAAESYQGGADTGAKLTDGAVEIDANLLRLRDGAEELLAGLIKLRDGSGELSAGLNDTAVPGSAKLATGAEELSLGLLKLDDGAGKLSDGSRRALRWDRRRVRRRQEADRRPASRSAAAWASSAASCLAPARASRSSRTASTS